MHIDVVVGYRVRAYNCDSAEYWTDGTLVLHEQEFLSREASATELRSEYADLLRSVGGIYHEVLVLEKDLAKMMGRNEEGTTGGQDA